MKRLNLSCISVLIAVFSIFNIASVNLLAAVSPNTDNSVKSPEEAHISFEDVEEEHIFYYEITRLAGLGILNGYPDGMFRSDKEITNAEFTKVLLHCMEILPEPSEELQLFPESWAAGYFAAAYSHGILTDGMLANSYNPDSPVTRGIMTEMTVRALNIYVPEASESPFTDTNDRFAVAAYGEYILRGYPSENGTRVCLPDSHATRGEAAAIAVRVVDYRSDPYNYKKEAVLTNASLYPLTTETEFLDLFYIMNCEFMTEFTFTTPLPYETWSSYYRLANVLYLEYHYSAFMNCAYKKNSNVYTIRYEYSEDPEILKKYHLAAEAIADAVLSAMITEDMSELDKAKAIHDYLVLNCEYDYENYVANAPTFRSRIAYGALFDRKAICQGYCSAFNLLAKRAGLRSAVVTGYAPGSTDNHAWNMVYIDGSIYYIDVTHDDPIPDRKGSVSHKYFMLTEQQMLDLGYIWDPDQTQLKYLY